MGERRDTCPQLRAQPEKAAKHVFKKIKNLQNKNKNIPKPFVREENIKNIL